jgi:hypothetical protein
MKKVTFKSIQGGLARVGSVAAVWTLLFSAAVQSKAGGDPSQGGSQTWDCLFSGGGDNGIAYLTFGSDFSITGEEILAPKQSTLNSVPTVGRGGEGDGRTPTTNSPTGTTTNEFLFGAGSVVGVWQYDAKSNIVGSFVLVGAPSQQDVSFTGRVSTGTKPRLTLTASFGQHHGIYNGVIAQTETGSAKFPDPTTGGWFGFKRGEGQQVFEQFTLTGTSILGVYDLSGSGPDYVTMGACFISSQGKIGFALLETNSVTEFSNLRSTIGSFSNTSTAIKANTTGIQENNSAVSFNPTMLK